MRQHVYCGEINQEFVRTFFEAAPRRLILCSHGGELGAMMAAVDYVQANKIEVLATGVVQSAATIILASAAVRMATPNTRIMVHGPKMGIESMQLGGVVEADLKDLKWYSRRMAEILANATTLPASHWRRLLASAGDHYFSVEDAAAMGLLTDVAEVKQAKA